VPEFAVFTRRDREMASRVSNALAVLLSLRRTMPMQLAVTYLHVVLEEGLTVGALAQRCGVEPSVMSKHISELYLCNRHHKDGLQLITMTQRVYGDRRERRVCLTERGRAVARQIGLALKDPKPVRKPFSCFRQILGAVTSSGFRGDASGS
jgi:DNA-binding MarR family transcriptional regulator